MTKSNKGAVVITGTSTGIGRATALLLDKQGYRVFAGVRTEKDGESLKQAASGNLTPIIMDITKAEDIKSASEFVSLAIGDQGLFALINNAYAGVDGPLEYILIDDIRRNFEINVIGQIVVTQSYLSMLRKAKGRIINISAVCGRFAIPYRSLLSTSKIAIEAITDSLRMELRSSGIDVLSILPEGIITPEQADKVEADGQKVLANMSLEMKAIYGKNFQACIERSVKGNRTTGLPVEKVTAVILEALEVRKPKRQYFVVRSPWKWKLHALYKRLVSHQYFYDNLFKDI
ncbi:SDR family NAD(P)-dependent oxidoreductase [Gloeocapsopsis dulcis]|uniref:Short-chain dehydrogenase n=1 Tax=Gloeocapsopsis dulcis AAB1 = 1H9 TaxID=1433147 RepID=A0A6N8FZ44_9CHRO|nr:SDR family NAD(P)-dependent oxidoreductase [Gloeocapsopsis dulcis]MUL37902.1 short-chain dehydrogenase [Gloeocapsopsis dulcis AAB1 = 1H9]WNN92292.1 SDR family NAD(P)-dependent oxidoreductase [Gloeocapsopsis dulcis]